MEAEWAAQDDVERRAEEAAGSAWQEVARVEEERAIAKQAADPRADGTGAAASGSRKGPGSA
jgi:hypothetical protein